jgi:HAE1 family hydrophobic/amphiphilic exporter-1
MVRFALEKSPDVAAQEVQNKVNAMVAQLPRGTTLPVIDKFDEDASPVITVVVSGRRDLREVTEIARRKIKEIIETVPGVGAVALVGERRRTVQITVDTDQMNQFRLSVDDVRRALASQNLELPGGRIDQGKRELVLRVLGRFNTTERFNDLVVATRGGYPIRIRDIGRAGESVEDPRTLARLDGVPAISLIVRKQSGSNTVEVVRLIKERLATIVKTLPDRHAGADGPRPVGLHQPEHRGGPVPPPAGRRPGLADDPGLHQRLADHADRHLGDPRVDHRHVRLHARAGVHAQ